ncbi:MAG: hypothetical protein V4751_09455 [Pseudomonadota bacterium]
MSQRRVLAVLPLLCMSLLVACASNGDSSSARPRLQPPGYAGVIGDNAFRVYCGTTAVVMPRHSMKNFYKEDGAEKTREEFCEEYRSDTLIRR